MVSDLAEETKGLSEEGLNPCCNGIWSQTNNNNTCKSFQGLNPCCNGIWSQTLRNHWINLNWVLILVVMEYGLRLGETRTFSQGES